MSTNATQHLRFALQTSILLTDLQHAQLQARFMSVLLGGQILFAMVDPALLLLAGDRQTVLVVTAGASALGCVGFSVLFLALAVLLLPFLAMQFGWRKSARRRITKLTCLVLVLAALAWFFLAFRCAHLHIGLAPPVVFARTGLGAILVAGALAFFLNAERLRSLEQPK